MRVLNKLFAGVIAAGVGVTATAAFAGDIRVGITMRMISENGQALIAGYKLKDKQLFFPNAKPKEQNK